jgi:hypothetical protein
LKVATLSKSQLTPHTSLPFSAIESKFLVGLTFRFILRDMIYSSQQRHNQGVSERPVWSFRREPVYQEISAVFLPGLRREVAAPYYQNPGLTLARRRRRWPRLAICGPTTPLFRTNRSVRLLVNQNDFLLPPEDLDWLDATFDPDQLTVFQKGGHLGNLANPIVQKIHHDRADESQGSQTLIRTLPRAGFRA